MENPTLFTSSGSEPSADLPIAVANQMTLSALAPKHEAARHMARCQFGRFHGETIGAKMIYMRRC